MKKKKVLSIICCVCLVLTFCFGCVQNFVFAENNVTCEFRNGTLNNGSVEYTINNQTVSIELATKQDEIFTKVNISDLQQNIDLDSASYYLKFTDRDNARLVNNGQTVDNMPGDGYLMLEESMFDNGWGIFELQEPLQQGGEEGQLEPPQGEEQGQPQPPQPPQPPLPPQGEEQEPPVGLEATVYPIVAYFEGVSTGVEMTEDGTIIIPDGWKTGKVTFKAKACTVEGNPSPNNRYVTPDQGSEYEIVVRVEGISNIGQLNGTVTGSNDRSYVKFNDGFDECGKASIHIASVEERGPVNTLINIVNKDIVYINASAPLEMSMSFGSAEVSQAIVTKDVERDLSVFFGNTKTTLKAEGINVDKISAVTGGKSVVLNNDGSATINLPKLSEETTTKTKVTILLKDGKSIVRTINIKRTAILLNCDERDKELKIGYVMNKKYLYNEQPHNDSIFDAYMQIILYKGNTVAGFKQIQVDDKEIVDALVNGTDYNGTHLPEGGSWSIETFDDKAIKLPFESMEGITKVSVFLTNGPIDFNSDTLPSIEFGIGSGVTAELGGEE